MCAKLYNYPFYFQKHEFKYFLGNKAILHSVKFLSDHHEKMNVVPTAASRHTVLASEALEDIGSEISKAVDKTKKRRLETADKEGVDRQNNDKTKQRRLESEGEILEEETNRLVRGLETGLEDIATLTGDSRPSETVTASDVEDIAPPPHLTPHKGNYLYSDLLYDLDNVPDKLYDLDNVLDILYDLYNVTDNLYNDIEINIYFSFQKLKDCLTFLPTSLTEPLHGQMRRGLSFLNSLLNLPKIHFSMDWSTTRGGKRQLRRP